MNKFMGGMTNGQNDGSGENKNHQPMNLSMGIITHRQQTKNKLTQEITKNFIPN